MDEPMLRKAAYAMPLNNPSYPPGPYRFIDREYMIITYRTDIDALQRLIPKPLEVTEPIVKYEFIRMPDSTGFGDYTESGQVIPVRLGGEVGGYVHAMFLNDTRRLPADVSSGVFQRSVRSRAWKSIATPSSAHWITDASALRPARWATSTANSTELS